VVALDDYLWKVTCGDCFAGLSELPDACAALAVVDGPYNMRKAEWDKFSSWEDFRAFYRPLWEQLGRVLRDNCSLYVFGTFEGLAALKQDLDGLGGGWGFRQALTWTKPGYRYSYDSGNMWPVTTEHALFYARERVDISALAWDGVTREDNTIRAYLNAERERAGVTVGDVNRAWQVAMDSPSGGMAGHWFGRSQWMLPTPTNYQWLRDLFNARGNGSGPYLRREYEDLRREYEDLRREYEDLRREYEDLRYTFNPQRGVTDVWDVPICAGAERIEEAGETAHVAQKPLTIIRRIIEASSNPGDVVVDPFAGLGTVSVACAELGRECVAFEIDPGYCAVAEKRIADALAQPRLDFAPDPLPETQRMDLQTT
jgi:site-specific DNA-methyltransferase (adenine-specific)